MRIPGPAEIQALHETMRDPGAAEIQALHEKYAPTAEAFTLVHTHCEIVWGIAEQLLAAPHLAHVDAELVRAGCLLHDIGVYRLYGDDGRLDHRNYIRHGLLGHEILQAEGFPDTLRRFCSHHTGGGLTRQDIVSQGLPLPPADYLAVTEEERLVMYADKFHTKSRPPAYLSPGEYAAHVRRFGLDPAEIVVSPPEMFFQSAILCPLRSGRCAQLPASWRANRTTEQPHMMIKLFTSCLNQLATRGPTPRLIEDLLADKLLSMGSVGMATRAQIGKRR